MEYVPAEDSERGGGVSSLKTRINSVRAFACSRRLLEAAALSSTIAAFSCTVPSMTDTTCATELMEWP